MDEARVRRGVVVRIVATAASADPVELELLRGAGIMYGDRDGYWAYFGDLDADSRRRLGMLLEAAERHGSQLELGVSYPHTNWHGRVLPPPVPRPGWASSDFDEQHGYVEPSNADTMLVLDAQYPGGGPTYQWWLSAEPPRGTHPDPIGAWETLCALADADPFAPAVGEPTYVQPSEPGVVTVQGIWRGRWVQATFTRQNDAEKTRWQRLRPLLQPL